jgi:hypothetical protein
MREEGERDMQSEERGKWKVVVGFYPLLSTFHKN